jgi:hypothetical protein
MCFTRLQKFNVWIFQGGGSLILEGLFLLLPALRNHCGIIYFLCRAQISGRQAPGLTRGSSPFYITNAGCEPRVKPGVWPPEMWAQRQCYEIFHRRFLK